MSLTTKRDAGEVCGHGLHQLANQFGIFTLNLAEETHQPVLHKSDSSLVPMQVKDASRRADVILTYCIQLFPAF